MTQMKSLLIIGVISATAFSSLLSAVSLNFAGDAPAGIWWPNMQPPKWSNGSLVAVQYPRTTAPVIWLAGPQGTRTVPFSIPGAQVLNVFDWDQGLDGTIGISGNATEADGRVSGFVAWISADATKSNVIRTSLYRPALVAVGADGTLWAAGTEFMSLNSRVLKPDSDVLRHFDPSGQMLSGFVPQSTIRNRISLLDVGGHWLRASRNLIAWYSPGEGRYVEVSALGRELLDIAVNRPGDDKSRTDGFGLTDKGDVFVSATWFVPPAPSTPDGKGGAEYSGIYVLDRPAQTWRPLLQRTWLAGAAPNASLDEFSDVAGVDGNRLVVRSVRRRLQLYDIGE